MPQLRDLQLPDGTWTWCRGWRDGLPAFGWGEAPAQWVTKSQLWEAGLRRRPRQDPVGLVVWRSGNRTAELFDRSIALPKRRMTPRWQESICMMQLAHYRCRRCGQEQDVPVSTKTWRCWSCMEETEDFGQPPGIDLANPPQASATPTRDAAMSITDTVDRTRTATKHGTNRTYDQHGERGEIA